MTFAYSMHTQNVPFIEHNKRYGKPTMMTTVYGSSTGYMSLFLYCFGRCHLNIELKTTIFQLSKQKLKYSANENFYHGTYVSRGLCTDCHWKRGL